MLKVLNLGLSGKARIWTDEGFSFPGDFPPVFYPVVNERIEIIDENAKISSFFTREVMIEILAPLGARFLYGCLGAIFEPNDSGKLVLKVAVSTEVEREVKSSLASSLDIVRVGIPEEYANSVFEGSKLKLQEPGVSKIIGSGEISFKWGTFGELGSSRAFFRDLSYTVIEVMVRDKVRANDNINPLFKKVLEQSL
ncbi:hypothetical protein H6G54_25110 [Anabaena cylindrica FACHB-243]|uniref:Uncharacterized protein n=1 Tax=Anabaena cylindrica (strain ATCC 27899 / PCC 7122) TaxID=272123 RepID=K9ZFY6_ANACC|nr:MULTISPECIES: hypothetical protein [Anabaena]AFZ57250.1 hypothetical protein Anacy_1756 [Anabaena cylindrica PCC 7122]MBD2420919.1 hypothetical protein [Anabaena cylindrica FACHB-243]MBY5283481.1 hypothetical protein [Anabaena sp. CCAP 1446/1C]MBY5308690.1 hypothetical protein [Anabaena sp. CCAP 1446/1C]MCM2405672.1 hypothetical protein [Anabaena sp. CCAP 1446/1C]